MSNRSKNSFSNRLTIYILSVCTVIFLIVFIILYVLPRISQKDNAVLYSEHIAKRVSDKILEEGVTIEHLNAMLKVEQVKALLLEGDEAFYRSLLQNYPELCGCAVEFDPSYKTYDYYAYKNRRDILFRKLTHDKELFSPERLVPEEREKRATHWSEYYYCYSHIKQRIVSHFEPLYDRKGEFAGFLRLDVVLEEFTSFVNEIKLYQTGYAFLIDKKGMLVTHPNPEIRMYNLALQYTTDNPEYNRLIKKAIRQESGSADIRINGSDFFVYYSRVPYTEWSLVQVSPYHEMYKTISRMSDLILICCITCLVLLFWIIIRVIKRVLHPLQEFAAIARTIADGHFNVPLPKVNQNDEVRELRDSFMYMQQRIVDSMEYLKDTTAEKEKFESEIRLAQNIQEKFLPQQNKLLEKNVSLYAILEQSRSVGGDMYNYFIKQEKLYMVECDVQGKGIPAALYMASISTLFNYVASTTTSPDEICNILNEYLCNNPENDMFITMFIGILDLETGDLRFSNAGHPYPILKKKDPVQALFLDEVNNIPLGIAPCIYKAASIRLQPGDLLLIYTDGITESQNENRAFYGKDNLLEFVRNTQAVGPEALVDHILADLIAYIGDMDESDDLTMVSVQYGKPELQSKEN